ncbi:Hypothetical protein ERGA_CDS_07390 [Ehrlichia ruminantium str. Gardel]|nr:Hypothetical protein ERGA_CDS_07390 [Ehrlichia ruminantium str. Gardel]
MTYEFIVILSVNMRSKIVLVVLINKNALSSNMYFFMFLIKKISLHVGFLLNVLNLMISLLSE